MVKPCRPDQFRNPATNRCKKITGRPGPRPLPQPRRNTVPGPRIPPFVPKARIPKGKKECRPDQYRNPASGRCKKISPRNVPQPPRYIPVPVVKPQPPVPPRNIPVPVKPEPPRKVPIINLKDIFNEDKKEDDVNKVGLNTQRVSDVITSLNQTLSKKEICVGHVLAYIQGTYTTNSVAEDTMVDWVNEKAGGHGRDFIRNENSDTLCFSLVFKLIQQNKKGRLYPRVLNQSARIIHNHATQLGMFSPDGKKCSLWYWDPSIQTIYREHEQWEKFDNNYKHKQWYKDMEKETELKNLKWNGHGPDYSHNTTSPDYPDEYWAYNTPSRRNMVFAKHIHSVWKNSPRYMEIKKKLDIWRNDFNKNIPRKFQNFADEVPSEKTFMSTLFILKELLYADNMTIIHPLDSTPLEGPQNQYGDGFCFIRDGKSELDKALKISGGGCVVWVEIYKMYSKYFASKFATVQELISFLNSNPLMGQTSAKNLLGKVMHMTYTKNKLSVELIKSFYDIIPNPVYTRYGRLVEYPDYTRKVKNSINRIQSYIDNAQFGTPKIPSVLKKEFILAVSNENNYDTEIITERWENFSNVSEDLLGQAFHQVRDSYISDVDIFKMMLLIASCKEKNEANKPEDGYASPGWR